MENILKKALELADLYCLDKNKFTIKVIKRNFMRERRILTYGINEYYFEVTQSNKVIYFPYFDKKNKKNDLEIWISSIALTLKHHLKIVKGINEGKKLRIEFKKNQSV